MREVRNIVNVSIRWATEAELDDVVGVLTEAAHWLARIGQPMWRPGEVTSDSLYEHVRARRYAIAHRNAEPVGVCRIDLEDQAVWPDADHEEAVYVHRLAVRRAVAGQGVSTALLTWAIDHARFLERSFVRLDCEAQRSALRSLYESFGFHRVADRVIGPFTLARYEIQVRAASRLAPPANSALQPSEPRRGVPWASSAGDGRGLGG